MALIALISAIPFPLKGWWKFVGLALPILALILRAVYEAGIRQEVPDTSVPIRIDLLFISPVWVFALWMGLFRGGLLLVIWRQWQTATQKRLLVYQAAAVLLGIAVIAFWKRPEWDFYQMFFQIQLQRWGIQAAD